MDGIPHDSGARFALGSEATKKMSDQFLPTMMPILQAARLTIRPLASEDLLACHRLFVEIGWVDPEASEAERLETRRRWLDWTIRNYVELGRLLQPPYGDRAIVLRNGDAFAGLVGLVPLLAPFAQLPSCGASRDALFSAEVGMFWAMSPPMQGKGYVTEAASAVIDFAFTHLRIARILACTEYHNERSIAVMRRLGMRIERNPFPDPPWFQITGILDAPNR